MGHVVDRCDIIDLLEEAVTLRRAVAVEVVGDRRFQDHVRDVITESGEDYAVFADHGSIAVSDIRRAARAEPVEPSYAGKR
jgi:Rho-binding antiterminator